MDNVWDQQPNEPHRWYMRFKSYLLAGPGRSLEGSWKREKAAESDGKLPEGRTPGAWRENADKWNWKERAESWDIFQAEIEETKWHDRRREIREREWEVSNALLNKAADMLNKDLGFCSWNLRDAGRFAEIASKLARVAARMDKTDEMSNLANPFGTVKNSADVFSNEDIAEIIKRLSECGIGPEQ